MSSIEWEGAWTDEMPEWSRVAVMVEGTSRAHV